MRLIAKLQCTTKIDFNSIGEVFISQLLFFFVAFGLIAGAIISFCTIISDCEVIA
jgi:hypothetical protein